MDVKQELFKKLDGIVQQGAILATNTSTLDVDKIAAATTRPEDVIGTHFFSPANVMRLLEVVRGKKTAKDVLATTMKLGKTLKKVPVVSGVCDGFIGNRMLEKYVQQSLFLLEEGATPAQVDGALQRLGMAMGPFAMYDMAGNDIGWEIRKRRAKERPDMVYSKFADRICEKGRFGQKSGRGWYRYEKGSRKPVPDPEVESCSRTTARKSRSRRARSPTTRSSSAASTRWRTKARASSRRASRCAPPTSTWSTSPATASRPTAADRCSMPTRWASTRFSHPSNASRTAIKARSGSPRRSLEARQRRQEVQWLTQWWSLPHARRSARAGKARSISRTAPRWAATSCTRRSSARESTPTRSTTSSSAAPTPKGPPAGTSRDRSRSAPAARSPCRA